MMRHALGAAVLLLSVAVCDGRGAGAGRGGSAGSVAESAGLASGRGAAGTVSSGGRGGELPPPVVPPSSTLQRALDRASENEQSLGEMGYSAKDIEERRARHEEEAKRRLRELDSQLRSEQELVDQQQAIMAGGRAVGSASVSGSALRGKDTTADTTTADPLIPTEDPVKVRERREALTRRFNEALELEKNAKPVVEVQDTRPKWAASQTDDALRSFAYGVVEELVNSIKGRLPCTALQYVISHNAWLVPLKQTGVIVDVGAVSGPSLRVLAATFPDRDVYAIGDPVGLKAPENVHIVQSAGGSSALSDVLVKGRYQEIGLVHFSCDDFQCVSAGFAALKPLMKAGGVIVFRKLVAYPSYMNGALRVLFEVLQDPSMKGLSFEIIGGRHIDANGNLCLTPQPKTDVCSGAVAVRLIDSTTKRLRLPGGHLLPVTMPIIAPMCPGMPSLEEQVVRGQAALNSSLNTVKAHLISQISSLVIDREESVRKLHRQQTVLKDLQGKILDMESRMTALMSLTAITFCAAGYATYRLVLLAVPKRGAWTR
ncbi:hypothetical protein DIPPA_18798 [Diplonema papillatum]|nr:hypothetical protein DIPPA_18798 [Diplonema papillatum]